MTKSITIKQEDSRSTEKTVLNMAAHRALSNRNIVAEIIKWFVEIPDHSGEGNEDQNNKNRPHRTSLCDLVALNGLWFDQIIPYIWKAPTNKNCSFHQRFAQVNENRLQTYANFVECGYLTAVVGDDLIDSNRILRGVTFPRLNQIDLVLRYREQKLCFPRISAPALQHVRIRIAWMVKSRIAEKVHFRFGHGRMPRLSSHLGHRLVGRLKVCRCESYGDFWMLY
jgi:hypothetical protein